MTPPLFPHQDEELLEHYDDPGRALLWQMRTGKSRAVVETSIALELEHGLRSVVLYAPNGVHSNWASFEVPKWTGGRVSITWDTNVARKNWGPWKAEALRKLKSRTPGAMWLAVPTHMAGSPECRMLVARALKRGPTLLVVDESDDYGSVSAIRTKFVHAVSRRCRWRRILSGTVVENSPLRAYAQFELLKKGALGYSTFGAFRARYAVLRQIRYGNRSPVEKVVGYQHLDELRDRMAQLSSVVLRSDVADLPPLEVQEVAYDLPPEAREVYDSLEDRLCAELPDGRVELSSASQKLSSLQLVCSGDVRQSVDDPYMEVPGAAEARLAALDEALGRSGTRSIVWCAFRRDVVRVKAHLEGLGWSCVTYYGGSKKSEREKARREFRSGSDGARVLVGHPAAAGRGLELAAAGAIVWYSHSFDAVYRAQANERATKVGGNPVPVFNVVARDTVDEYVLTNLAAKRDVSEELARGGLKRVLQSKKYAVQETS